MNENNALDELKEVVGKSNAKASETWEPRAKR